MYIYMNTCVCMCEHMCIYIYMCVSILLGETCLQTGTLTTHLGDTEICSVSLPHLPLLPWVGLRRGRRKRKLQQSRF